MRLVFWVFVALYVIALSLFVISILGWFGAEQDPLSGVFLIPLGMPWNLFGDKLGLASPALAIAAPLVNAALLLVLCRKRSS